MRVGFLHLDLQGQENARGLATIMVRSAREAMPKAEIVQMTDEFSPRIEGVDTVIRRAIPGPWLMHYRLDHFRHFPEGEVMFIDTDAVVQKDTSQVFEQPFDVALTRRVGDLIIDGKSVVKDMPYNSGVMFSRSRAFWDDCYAYSATLSDKLKHWYGDQYALRIVTESGKHKVLDLSCDEYNYSPSSYDEDVSRRFVVHYKGPTRKQWMLRKYLQQMEAA